jgi:DNA-binding NarL/FixJ family response regulator
MKVLIADDHQVMREGLRALLSQHAGVEVVAEAADGYEVLREAEAHRPDVVLMDVDMPRLNGILTTRRLSGEETHRPKVIALSAKNDARTVINMMQAGASGYIWKNAAFQEVMEALQRVASGEVYLSSSIKGVVPSQFTDHATPEAMKLAKRERETLRVLVETGSPEKTAEMLMLSMFTIERHIDAIVLKLNASNIKEVIDRFRASKRLINTLSDEALVG